MLSRAKNPKFVTESTRTPPKELTIKKKFKFNTSQFTKICHFEITKQKKCPNKKYPSQTLSPVGEEHPYPQLTPLVLRCPNFELALTPLHIICCRALKVQVEDSACMRLETSFALNDSSRRSDELWTLKPHLRVLQVVTAGQVLPVE